MSATKFTKTPSPIEVVEKVNAIIDDSGYWEAGEAVSVGDIRFVPGRDNSGYVLECVQAGTTGTTAPSVSDSDLSPEATTASDLNDLQGTLAINKGGTGATTAAGALTKLGITATAAELNYVDGVTSAIQTQLNGKLSTTGTAAKATADASGNTITSTYETKANAITGLSVSGKTITYTKGNGSTGTITTQDTNTTYSAATQSAQGLMSAADKTKLDGIATGANKYSLPTASASTLGGIKVGSGLTISDGVLSSSGGSAAVSAYKIPYATCSTAASTAAKVATITNGVSFSLVAGACCYIVFLKAITPKNSNLKWTVNINSTGAKYYRTRSTIYEAYFSWEHRSDNTYQIYTDAFKNAHNVIKPTTSNELFIYDGSYYVSCGGFTTASYSDYNDA